MGSGKAKRARREARRLTNQDSLLTPEEVANRLVGGGAEPEFSEGWPGDHDTCPVDGQPITWSPTLTGPPPDLDSNPDWHEVRPGFYMWRGPGRPPGEPDR